MNLGQSQRVVVRDLLGCHALLRPDGYIDRRDTMSSDEGPAAVDIGVGHDVFDVGWRVHWSLLSVIQHGDSTVEHGIPPRYNLS